jgi:NAD(P)-dependent dehydrogenase (short-subunit alcohol dehydrogenase family)
MLRQMLRLQRLMNSLRLEKCARALGVEFAHKGVRVNAIAPGWITVENYATAIPVFDLQKATEDARRTAKSTARFGWEFMPGV